MSVRHAVRPSAPESARSPRREGVTSRLTRFVAATASVALVASGIAVISAVPAAAASGSVQGRVFQDFNSNGVYDTPTGAADVVDTGLSGVTVTAYNAAGAVVGTAAQSAANGTYSINTTSVPNGTALRVEFTGLPAGYQSSFHGTNNGTSVQFVTAGAEGVDYGVLLPDNYNPGNPGLAVAIQSAGLTTATTTKDLPALVATPWSVAENPIGTNGAANFPDRRVYATYGQVGSINSTAFDRSGESLFAAATYKRLSALGPQGLGGIYRVPGVLTSTGALAANGVAGPVQNWLNVTDLDINVGQSTIETNAQRGLGQASAAVADINAFQNAAKVGIGGIAIDEATSTLYFVNLYDEKIYGIDIATKTLKGSWATPAAASANQRPNALLIRNSTIYVGWVDTGEATPFQAMTASQHYYVGSAPLSAAGPGAFTTVLEGGLGYQKGNPISDWAGQGTGVATANPQVLRWNTWTDTWNGTGNASVGFNTGWGPTQVYPQPVLSSIAIESDGFLTVGFQDRTSIQGGNRNVSASTPSVRYNNEVAYFETVSSGDMLLASPDGDGTYTPESAGVAGTRTATAGRAQQPTSGEGPGGNEFWYDRQNKGNGTNHREAALGSVVAAAGIRQVASTLMDPLTTVRVTGLAWFNSSGGNNVRGYEHTLDNGSTSGAPTFQKGGGLGAVALVLADAPVEIGNRVWFDADQNGRQDADEPAIQGVKVELLDKNGTVIGSTTTDSSGSYYFASNNPQLPAFTPNGAYSVRFVKPTPSTGTVTLTGANAAAFGSLTWADLSLTKQASQTATPTTDSNPDPTTGTAAVLVGAPGHNDHTIDAGYVANGTFSLTKLFDESTPPTAGQTFTLNVASAKDFRGANVLSQLTQTSFVVGTDGAAVPAAAARQKIPVGTSITISELSDPSIESVSYDPSNRTRVITANGGSSVEFRVTNKLYKPGKFSVSKAVTGDFDLDSPELQAAVFTVGYTYAGGSGQLVLNKANSFTATSVNLPYGAVVTLSETSITGAGPSVSWGTPTWSANPVTIGNGTTTKVTLTNPSSKLVGGFTVAKAVTGDAAGRVPAATTFQVEYSLDKQAWTALPTVTNGNSVVGPTNIPVGTVVYLREVAPAAIPGVQWGTPVFSGTGVTPGSPASVTIAAGQTPVAVQLTNPTTPRNGQFSVTKDVTGPGEQLLADDYSFTINYTYPGQTPTPGTISVANGGSWTSPALPEGTVVTLTEVVPTGGLPAGASWGTPVLKINGAETSVPNGSTFTIGDATTVAVVVQNPTTTRPTVEITKGDGDAKTGTIVHEADTIADGEVYTPGETRDIVIQVKNPGPEPLREVTLTDDTLAGAEIKNLVWTFPDGSVVPATWDASAQTWTADWAATHVVGGTAAWQVGTPITGVATLKLDNSGSPHQDRARVEAKGQYSGTPVSDENDYNAFTGAIQVIKYDGQKADPVVKDPASGEWVIPTKPLADADQDANDVDHAVEYPVDTAQKVRWVVTNTGSTWLTDLTLTDVTDGGPAIGDDWTADLSAFGGPESYSFINSGPWDGLLPPGASFFAEGTLTLAPEQTHADTVTVVGTVVVPAANPETGEPTDEPALNDDDKPVPAHHGDGSPFTVTDNDPFHAWTGVGPKVQITKGDGTGTTIVNEADTVAEGELYKPGESRQIVIRVQNTGDEPLVDVKLADTTTSGGQIVDLEWTLPDGKSAAATKVDQATWSFEWDGPWLPKEWITGHATLTVAASAEPHQDSVRVDAVGQASGKPVSDDNDYNAFTGAIQVIKYDGEKPDPVVKDGENWVIPAKPLADLDQDANDVDHAVEYPVDTPRKVRWVVTNTGTTWLTNLTLEDVTGDGPEIGDDWTADLSAFGGPSDYSFVEDGPWDGLFAPGASFFAEGTLTLAPEQTHADTVTVVGTVVVPAADRETGVPTDRPSRDEIGNPIPALNPDGTPFTVTDNDPFHAWTGVGPYVDIEKGDGEGTTIEHDADTMSDAQFYEPGESRTIVYRVTNTGDEELREVVLGDVTLSGGVVESLVFTLPDGSSIDGEYSEGEWTAVWEDTFGEGKATWLPGEVITGTATLTVALADEPHVNRAWVDAVGAASGKPVGDQDDYNAVSAGIQVIKYDGNKADPAVKDAEGNWITPVKPLVDAAQDANDSAHAVQYAPNKQNKVRWVVTNTGTTWLTEITLQDVTGRGPAIGSTWTADLSAFGGPSSYSFVEQGTWYGLIPPGASFFAEGTLALEAGATHQDTVTVTGTPVVPAVDEGGVPTGEPSIGDDGAPILVKGADGKPIVLTDDDPFNAYTLLPATGMRMPVSIVLVALGLLLGGAVLWMISLRRRRAGESAI